MEQSSNVPKCRKSSVPGDEENGWNETWSVALESDSYLPGANGPHMGMGIGPPSAPATQQQQPRRAVRTQCAESKQHKSTISGSFPQDVTRPSLCSVPHEVIVKSILQHLPPKPLILAAQVCNEWSLLCSLPGLWRNLFLNVKFWRIWYNEPEDWKAEFKNRHMQELVNDKEDTSHSDMEVDGAAEGEGLVPIWHRKWHGEGDGITEGVTCVRVRQDDDSRSDSSCDEAIQTFSSIQHAIDTVEENTRIILSPGVYNESVGSVLRVDKPGIELVGEGGAASSVVLNANVELGMSNRLANMNIRTQPTDNNEGSVKIVEGSKANIEDCDIQGSVILSQGTDGLVRNNRIHSGLQNGLLVHGGGTIVNNDITGHKMCGMVLKGEADPVVRNNTFSKNNLAGIVIGDVAHGVFESNKTVENSHYGMAVGACAEPIIRGNHCRSNGLGGMLVTDNSAGKLENNEVSDNTGHGIMFAGANKAVAVGNTLRRNTEAGLAVRDTARPSVEDNRVNKNNGPGVIIQDTSAPVMRRNKLKTNEREGIVVMDQAGGTIEHNQVSNNRLAGIELNENSTSTLRSNTVSQNRGAGIVVRHQAQASIVQNKVQRNELSGVSIEDQAQITLTENLVSHNQSAGIQLADQTDSVVEKNHVLGNALSGIEITGAKSSLRENRVSRNAHAGCIVGSTSGNVVLEENTFKHNTLSEVVVQNLAKPTLINNSVTPHALRPNAFPGLPDSFAETLAQNLSLQHDQILAVGVGRMAMQSLHAASREAKLCIYGKNDSPLDVTVTFEHWKADQKKNFSVKLPPGKEQLLIPALCVSPPCDIWCYAPVQGVSPEFETGQVVLYGYCLIADCSQPEGWRKCVVTPSQQPVGQEYVGSTQARYERNTGCQGLETDTMSE